MKTSCQVAKAGVTRRGFLGLAAASAVIAGSGIAGCSPAKPSKTDADAEQAQTALEIDESEIKETKEADVVVVGLGVSGVAAMRSAAEAGAHVIAVEKNEHRELSLEHVRRFQLRYRSETGNSRYRPNRNRQ